MSYVIEIGFNKVYKKTHDAQLFLFRNFLDFKNVKDFQEILDKKWVDNCFRLKDIKKNKSMDPKLLIQEYDNNILHLMIMMKDNHNESNEQYYVRLAQKILKNKQETTDLLFYRALISSDLFNKVIPIVKLQNEKGFICFQGKRISHKNDIEFSIDPKKYIHIMNNIAFFFKAKLVKKKRRVAVTKRKEENHTDYTISYVFNKEDAHQIYLFLKSLPVNIHLHSISFHEDNKNNRNEFTLFPPKNQVTYQTKDKKIIEYGQGFVTRYKKYNTDSHESEI